MAQTNSSGRWLVYPCVRASTPPVIDGRLDDPAWQSAVPVSGFRQTLSDYLVPTQALMRLLWDDKFLYLAVEVEEPLMDKLVVTAHGRDAYVFNDDCLEWFLDPAHGHRLYYQFGVNAAGAMFDGRIFDVAWDCPWQAAATRGEKAWYVECALPIADLTAGRSVRPGDLWGFNLCRERQTAGSRELIDWANVQGNFHSPDLFGHLAFVAGLDDLTAPRRAAIAAAVGRPAQIFGPDGWWWVDTTDRYVRYQDDLADSVNVKQSDALREVRAALKDHHDSPLWAEYVRLSDRWEETRGLARGAVGPVEWAHRRQEVDKLETVLPELLWRVRLDALLETF
jgi:hypothetical protein